MNIQESQTKISFEAESGNLLEQITKVALKDFIKDTGIEDPVYYYTFLENDYDRKIIRLVVTNSPKNRTALTIPKDDEEAKKAWDYFLKLNSHLNISPEISFGYNGDDFIYNRVTTKVFFTPKSFI